jgi:hypothetical protein
MTMDGDHRICFNEFWWLLAHRGKSKTSRAIQRVRCQARGEIVNGIPGVPYEQIAAWSI